MSEDLSFFQQNRSNKGKKGHRKRVRDKILQNGLEGFSEYNILEYLLFFGIPQKDTEAFGMDLTRRYGSLNKLLQAPFDEIYALKNMTFNSAALFKVMSEAVDRYLEGKSKSDPNYIIEDRFISYIKKIIDTDCKENKFYLLKIDDNSEVVDHLKITDTVMFKFFATMNYDISEIIPWEGSDIIIAHHSIEAPLTIKTEIDKLKIIKERLKLKKNNVEGYFLISKTHAYNLISHFDFPFEIPNSENRK